MRQQSNGRMSKAAIGLMVVFFIGALAFVMAPEEVCAETATAGSWQELQNELGTLDNTTIQLSEYCAAAENDTCLILPEGRNITLDLNGKMINRNRSNGDWSNLENGVVMKVYGTLEITDSQGGGVITGGYGQSGACEVSGGSLTVKGGTITGNFAYGGATVNVVNNGTFTLDGGSISQNRSDGCGGVSINNGYFEMLSGEIKNNESYYVSAVNIKKGTFVMQGGKISNNTGEAYWPKSINAQVALDNENAVFELNGGTIEGTGVHTEDPSYNNSAGVMLGSGTLKLSGEPVFHCKDYADLYLAEGITIDVTGELGDELSLNVLTEEKPEEDSLVTVTNGLESSGDIFNFSSYEEYGVGENDDGEAVFGIPAEKIIYKAGIGTGNDVVRRGIKDWSYSLPDCLFTPPDGMEFTGWKFWLQPAVHEPGETFDLTREERITAQYECMEHEWMEPEYEWSNDNSTVTAKHTCSVDYKTETETVPVTLEVDEPTCEEGGLKTWTTEEFENEDFEEQTKTEDLDALGHSWGAWKVTKKANALTKGLKQRVCAHDSSHVQKQTIPATGVSGTLMTKMTTKGSKGLKVSWTKVKGAEGYDIFFAPCNVGSKQIPCKKVKTIIGNKTFSWTKKGLKKQTAYKVYVKAFAAKDGKKTYIRTSPTMHAFASGYDKKCTNAKAVTLKKTAVALKKGKTYTIKANVTKLKPKKKLMAKGHAAKLRYLSSNKKIATVSKSGKIIAKAKGTCIIYAYAHNGLRKGIKVTVK